MLNCLSFNIPSIPSTSSIESTIPSIPSTSSIESTIPSIPSTSSIESTIPTIPSIPSTSSITINIKNYIKEHIDDEVSINYQFNKILLSLVDRCNEVLVPIDVDDLTDKGKELYNKFIITHERLIKDCRFIKLSELYDLYLNSFSTYKNKVYNRQVTIVDDLNDDTINIVNMKVPRLISISNNFIEPSNLFESITLHTLGIGNAIDYSLPDTSVYDFGIFKNLEHQQDTLELYKRLSNRRDVVIEPDNELVYSYIDSLLKVLDGTINKIDNTAIIKYIKEFALGNLSTGLLDNAAKVIIDTISREYKIEDIFIKYYKLISTLIIDDDDDDDTSTIVLEYFKAILMYKLELLLNIESDIEFDMSTQLPIVVDKIIINSEIDKYTNPFNVSKIIFNDTQLSSYTNDVLLILQERYKSVTNHIKYYTKGSSYKLRFKILTLLLVHKLSYKKNRVGIPGKVRNIFYKLYDINMSTTIPTINVLGHDDYCNSILSKFINRIGIKINLPIYTNGYFKYIYEPNVTVLDSSSLYYTDIDKYLSMNLTTNLPIEVEYALSIGTRDIVNYNQFIINKDTNGLLNSLLDKEFRTYINQVESIPTVNLDITSLPKLEMIKFVVNFIMNKVIINTQFTNEILNNMIIDIRTKYSKVLMNELYKTYMSEVKIDKYNVEGIDELEVSKVEYNESRIGSNTKVTFDSNLLPLNIITLNELLTYQDDINLSIFTFKYIYVPNDTYILPLLLLTLYVHQGIYKEVFNLFKYMNDKLGSYNRDKIIRLKYARMFILLNDGTIDNNDEVIERYNEVLYLFKYTDKYELSNLDIIIDSLINMDTLEYIQLITRIPFTINEIDLSTVYRMLDDMKYNELLLYKEFINSIRDVNKYIYTKLTEYINKLIQTKVVTSDIQISIIEDSKLDIKDFNGPSVSTIYLRRLLEGIPMNDDSINKELETLIQQYNDTKVVYGNDYIYKKIQDSLLDVLVNLSTYKDFILNKSSGSYKTIDKQLDTILNKYSDIELLTNNILIPYNTYVKMLMKNF